jgi:hypothetical protein
VRSLGGPRYWVARCTAHRQVPFGRSLHPTPGAHGGASALEHHRTHMVPLHCKAQAQASNRVSAARIAGMRDNSRGRRARGRLAALDGGRTVGRPSGSPADPGRHREGLGSSQPPPSTRTTNRIP